MPVLVAVGGGAQSTATLTFAAHLTSLIGSELVLLTVVKREQQRGAAEAAQQRAAFVLEPLVGKYRTLIRVGHPAEEILAEAEGRRYQVAVVGENQQPGFLTRFVLGSTALRVVEHAPCPVAVVKGQISSVRRILICDSGLTAPSLIDRTAVQLPKVLAGANDITVLHVMSQMSAGPGIDGHLLRADAGKLIEEHAPEGELLMHDMQSLQHRGYPSTPKVRHGRVVDEILAEAREGEYDLVIIGAHAGTGWRRILLDDIAHEVVVGLDRPVLVVR